MKNFLKLSVALLLLTGCSVLTTTHDTMQLQFKERRDSLTDEEKKADADYNAKQREYAGKAKADAASSDFTVLASHSKYIDLGRGGVFENQFKDSVPADIQELLFTTLKPGEVSEVHDVNLNQPGEDGKNNQKVLAGYSVLKLIARDSVMQMTHESSKATVTHILISFQGAVGADPSITRTKEEARQLAIQVLKITRDQKTDFTKEVMAHSDDPSKTENGGLFKDQIIGESDPSKNAFVREFNDAIVSANAGEIVGPIETPFGFHIIRIEAKAGPGDASVERPRISYQEIFFPTHQPTDWRETGLDEGKLEHALARPVQNQGFGYEVALKFNPEGAKLFGEITKRNIGKQIAIFLKGQLISTPSVQSEISGGEAVISGSFTAQQAKKLAAEINNARAEK